MSLLPITIEQTNQVLEALPEDHQLHLFARHYCQNLSQVLWQRFSVREWCVFLQERYQNFLVATKQEGLILVGKGEGRATGRIVVEVLKPDMQYQLLTLLELLRDLDQADHSPRLAPSPGGGSVANPCRRSAVREALQQDLSGNRRHRQRGAVVSIMPAPTSPH